MASQVGQARRASINASGRMSKEAPSVNTGVGGQQTHLRSTEERCREGTEPVRMGRLKISPLQAPAAVRC